MPCNCDLTETAEETYKEAIYIVTDIMNICEYLWACDLTLPEYSDRTSSVFRILAITAQEVYLKLDHIRYQLFGNKS